MSVLIEGCVDSVASALAAQRGGAGRLELCECLDVGGTTPSTELVSQVKRAVSIPVFVIVRPRGGDFIHTRDELDVMARAIPEVLAAGADGVVIGVLTSANEVNAGATRELVALANGRPVTFHKAFDVLDDRLRALETLIDCGISRILTSGGAPTAFEGRSELERLVDAARGRVVIMAGGKVRADNVRAIVDDSGVTEVHARCELDACRIGDIQRALADQRPRAK